jgi:hypothetical protein
LVDPSETADRYGSIRYVFGPTAGPEGWIDPLEHRDAKLRLLVEAFTSISLTERNSYGAIEYQPDLDELEAFVLAFGPVLVTGDLRSALVQASRVPFGGQRPGDAIELVGMSIHNLDAVCGMVDALARQEDDTPTLRQDLALALDQYLPGLEVHAAVGSDGRIAAAFRPRSLLDVMAWQLLEHTRRRPARSNDPGPAFELPKCGLCGGRILSTRLAEGNLNRWHTGCKKTGQARERRRRRSGREGSK